MASTVQVQYNRTRKVTVRFTLTEYECLHQQFSQTTCRQISAYIRRLVLGKPLTVFVRNQSLDDLLEVLVSLKGALNAIGNNYNQAVKKLHTLRQLPEFRNWLATHEQTGQALMQTTTAVGQRLAQISDTWWQESKAAPL